MFGKLKVNMMCLVPLHSEKREKLADIKSNVRDIIIVRPHPLTLLHLSQLLYIYMYIHM